MKHKNDKPGLAWYALLATGLVLIVIPEPATTATGLAIVAGSAGYRALGDKK